MRSRGAAPGLLWAGIRARTCVGVGAQVGAQVGASRCRLPHTALCTRQARGL